MEYFNIDKTKKLINQKKILAELLKKCDVYVKGCNICLLFKTIRYKLYSYQ